MNTPPLEIQERTFGNLVKRRIAQKLHKPAAPFATGKPIVAGVIGAGNIVRGAYVWKLKNKYPFRLAAVFDVNKAGADQVAHDTGARSCGSLAELVNDPEIEAVFICTPEKFHCDSALAALAARKHVLCEKPLAHSHEEAKRMVAAAKEAGVTTFVNFSFRFRPEVIYLSQLLQSGIIGKVYHVWGTLSQGKWFNSVGEPANERNDAAPWKYSAGGGVLGDLGPHLVDILRYWLGEITQVQGWMASFRDGPMVAEDIAGISLWFGTGPIAQAATSRWATGYKERAWFEIHGSEGAIIFEPGAIKLWTRTEQRWRELMIPPATTNFLDAFHAAITTGSTASPNFSDGLKNNEVLAAIAQSARTGQVVKLSDTGS